MRAPASSVSGQDVESGVERQCSESGQRNQLHCPAAGRHGIHLHGTGQSATSSFPSRRHTCFPTLFWDVADVAHRSGKETKKKKNVPLRFVRVHGGDLSGGSNARATFCLNVCQSSSLFCPVCVHLYTLVGYSRCGQTSASLNLALKLL